MTKVALTIAGSDSSGGAGIAADLRTFAFHCVHGACAITCVTAQNTLGVERVDWLSPEAVIAQIEAVGQDLGLDSAKTGMLGRTDLIEAVAQQLTKFAPPLVVDPVMVSRAGSVLIEDQAIAALKQQIIPLADVVTPNRYEAQLLCRQELDTLEDLKSAAAKIAEMGAKTVLVKGGSLAGKLKGTDVWFDGEQWHILQTAIINTSNTHGTGCTLSAAIAAQLALGQPLSQAIIAAKKYVTAALSYSLNLGEGIGPIGHFFPLLSSFQLD
jgi:hydroxymethylpyrimidine/phosphomethylpyrimidine kinase